MKSLKECCDCDCGCNIATPLDTIGMGGVDPETGADTCGFISKKKKKRKMKSLKDRLKNK